MLRLLTIFFLLNYFYTKAQTLAYNFSEPEMRLILPPILHEVSGIAILDSFNVACIQDEEGILFIYNTKTATLNKQISFGTFGDYEGIARVEKSLYVLRSDGNIFEIADYTTGKLNVKEHKTGVPAFNNEGLCYDASGNRLLIGAKGKINKDPLYKDKRFIYEFMLDKKQLNSAPLYSYNTISVNQFAKQQGIVSPKRKTKQGKIVEAALKFNTSELAIHPLTKELYILSANDFCIFICESNGQLKYIEQLNPIMFNKAEGLAFYPNGDLLITNEGQTGNPTLLKFKYNK